MSPQIATVRPGDAALVAADGEGVKQRLRRVFVRAVACIDHGTVDLAGEKMHGSRLVMTHDDDIGAHGVEGDRGVDQRLALLYRGRADRHVHHIGAEALACELERGLRARRRLEEEVDLGATTQGRGLLLDLPVEGDMVVSLVEKARISRFLQPFDAEEVAMGIGDAAGFVIKADLIGRAGCRGKNCDRPCGFFYACIDTRKIKQPFTGSTAAWVNAIGRTPTGRERPAG